MIDATAEIVEKSEEAELINEGSSESENWTKFNFFDMTSTTTTELPIHPFIADLDKRKQVWNSIDDFVELFQAFLVKREAEISGYLETRYIFPVNKFILIKFKHIFHLYFTAISCLK